MWTLLREVSIRHLKHSPLRTALVVFGIALGVCMLSAILATNNSLGAAFADMVDRVKGRADLTVAGSDAGIADGAELTGQIADLDEVANAAAMLEVTTQVVDSGEGAEGPGDSILVLGVDFLGDKVFLPFAQEGDENVVEDPLAFANDPEAILVSRKLADRRALKVDDAMELQTVQGPKKFFIRGLLEDKGPASSFDGQVAVMALDAAQIMFGRGFAVDRIDIVVNREKGREYSKDEQKALIDAAQVAITGVVDGRGTVEAPEGRTERLVPALFAFQNALNMSGMVALWVGMFLIYNAVAVSVAQRRREVGVLRALGVTRDQVVRLFCLEALVMGTIGVAVGLLMAQYLADMALASVSESVDRFVMPIRPPSPDITPMIAIMGGLAGYLTTLFASYVPAKRTNRVDPAEALRATRSSSTLASLPSGRLCALGLAVGLACMVPAAQGGVGMGYVASALLSIGGALMVPWVVARLHRLLVPVAEKLMGIPGRLALDNVERALGRSSITVVALMLAVGMSVTLGSWTVAFEKALMQWGESAYPAEVMITAGSPMVDRHNIPFAGEQVDKLRQEGIEGVQAINPVRIIVQDMGSRRVQLASLDSESYLKALAERGVGRRVLASLDEKDGKPVLSAKTLTDKQRIVISDNVAVREGYEIGDKLELNTPTGTKVFEVCAVVVDYSSTDGWSLIDRSWYIKYWRDTNVDKIDVYLAAGLRPLGSDDPAYTKAEADRRADLRLQVRKELRIGLGASAEKKEGDKADVLFVTNNDQLKQQLKESLEQVFAFAKAPELVTLLVALMGVIGTMLAAVIDRIREVGMLRAIGATRNQVTGSIVVEAAFLGVAAAVWGIAGGIPHGYLFVKVIGLATSGWNLPYQFPLETALRVGLAVIATAAIAGFFPGRRAAGMDVKEALAYE